MKGRTLIDITGQRFGRITVLHREESPPKYKNSTWWKCVCDCGKTIYRAGTQLRQATIKEKSCGCRAKERRQNIQAQKELNRQRFDLTGQRFGQITVLHRDGSFYYGKRRCKRWKCICDCGKIIYCARAFLRSKTEKDKSCGCLQAERSLASRERKRLTDKLWHENHHERKRLVDKRYYDSHKAEILSKQKQYKTRCWEQLSWTRKRWRESHKQEIALRDFIYRGTPQAKRQMLERLEKSAQAWIEAHPEAISECPI